MIFRHQAPESRPHVIDRFFCTDVLVFFQDSNLSQIEEKKEEKEGWFKAYVKTIIGNIQVSLSNVHIRYEDATSSPGHPFATGVFLGNLNIKTVDEEGNETFVKSGALQLIRKVKKTGDIHTHMYICVRRQV